MTAALHPLSASPLPPPAALPASAPALDGAAVDGASGRAVNGAGGAGTGGAGAGNATAPLPASPGTAPVFSVSAAGATSATAATTPIVAAVQAALANTVNLSPQAQQAVKFEAFQQLVAGLVQQIQGNPVQLPEHWPAGGVPRALQALVTSLLQQATAPQPLPQQLVSVQSWPSLLTQAVLQHAGDGTLPGTPTGTGAAGEVRGNTGPLPALQNWLVQQGTVQAQDGERGFTLTLRVPVAWAQAQAALGTALGNTLGSSLGTALAAPGGTPPAMPGGASGLLSGAPAAVGFGAPPGGNLQLPFAGSVQQLANGSLGLVMQPQAIPGSAAAIAAQALRTSAVLELEFQPLPASVAQAQAVSVYLPAQLLPQDMQALLQGRGPDPWLLMAQAQAHGQPPKQTKDRGAQDGLCQRAGCQYQGRAACAQPFCAEMNYLWSVARAQRRA